MTSTDILYADPLQAASIAASEIAARTGIASHDVALVMGSGLVHQVMSATPKKLLDFLPQL